MRGEMINKLNSEDRKAFRRWLWIYAVYIAMFLTGLIALAAKNPGAESGAIAQNPTTHTQAKLP